VLAYLRRSTVSSWARALGDGAACLLPLAAAPLVLFRDDIPARLMLFAAVVAITAGLAVFRCAPALAPGPSEHRGRAAMFLMAVAAAVVFAALSLLRHAGYWSSIVDLGLFHGALRSTVTGEGFLFVPEMGVTFMAEHFSPILVALAPPAFLFDTPAALLVVQALAAAGGAYLLYRVAEETLDDGRVAPAICASYLLAPDMFQSQSADFHVDTLMPPMIFGAALALRRGNARWFVLCCALLWTAKEDAFIYGATLGLWAWLGHGRRRLGIAVLASSAAVGLLVLGVALPAWRTFQEPGEFFGRFTGEGYEFASRYSHLGADLGAAAIKIVTDPIYAAGWILRNERLASLLVLLVPLGFMALAGGLRTAILLAPLGVPLLASDANMHSLEMHYGAIPLAFAWLAGIAGLASAVDRFGRRAGGTGDVSRRRILSAAAAYVGAAALWLAWGHPESPLSPVHERPAYMLTDRTRLLDEVVKSIPPGVPVSATGHVGVHLMNRPRSRMLPFGVSEARFVVADLHRPPWPLDMPGLARLVEGLAADPAWGVRLVERGVFVLERGAPRDRNERAIEEIYQPVIEPEEWESSDFPNLAVRMRSASGGAALVVTPDDRRGRGFLYYGPFLPLPPGRWRVEFRLAAQPEPGRSADAVLATIDVFRNHETIAARDLRAADFGGRWAWRTFALEFDRDVEGAWEFRVFHHDAGTVALDRIRVTRVDRAPGP
ncbi:MAG: DUF2079 domain-containing protein, partial [Myxococcota bacterium]|nr:DUF2079 domain-containing protein [Myxococcota bacterium]